MTAQKGEKHLEQTEDRDVDQLLQSLELQLKAYRIRKFAEEIQRTQQQEVGV